MHANAAVVVKGNRDELQRRVHRRDGPIVLAVLADVGADVGLVPGRRGCGRGFCVWGAIGVGQKTTVEGHCGG